MRTFILLLLLGQGFVNIEARQPAPQKLGQQPFSISVSAMQAQVAAGAPIELRVRLTNTSNHDINASASYDRGMDISYQYDVRGESGAAVQPREERHEGGRSLTAELLALKPGESAEEVTAIGGQYDLAPGKYAVQLLRRVSSDPKEGVVKSNTITVTVVPESFSIGISAQKAEVKSGSAISLTVRLTNTSNRVMALPGSPSESADPSYTYSCYSSAGIPVAKHYPIMRSVENHPMNITLKPGESRTQVVPIDSVCSLSKPGNYRIQVSRIDQGEPQHSVVKSNEIKITVKP